jgi:hypothetical protein
MIAIERRPKTMPVETDITDLQINPYTLGDAIKDKRMWVDTYQRHYAWKADHVRDLYEDFEKVIARGSDAEHFLGTVVVEVKGGKVKIVDGQQRIATTMVLLAAMRDHFYTIAEHVRADAYQSEFLYSINVDTLNPESHLILNTDDHDFFTSRIVLPPQHAQRIIEESKDPSLESHILIMGAAEIAKETIKKIVKDLPKHEAIERIGKWKNFILQKSRVIWIVVPDDGTAYSVFETMNDRGLSLSATDLLKNLLFALAQEDDSYRVKIQEHWFLMAGTMNAIEKLKDAVPTYVRHLWISLRTKATVNDLYKVIKRNINGKQDALKFAKMMRESAPVYAALLNKNHSKWSSYPETVAEHINTINRLHVATVRPLLLSGVERFAKKPDLLRKFFHSVVNWSVRFLVAGRLGSGTLEERYGLAARKLRSGEIKTIDEIRDQLKDVLPTDEQFKNLFSQMTVSQSFLQRYYLATLEAAEREGKDDLIPMAGKYNIEHVLPQSDKAWLHIPPETKKAYTNRLGNVALLQVKKNELVADWPFPDKKPVLAASHILLTKQMAEYDDWNVQQIKDRQDKLAALAVKAWPLKVK